MTRSDERSAKKYRLWPGLFLFLPTMALVMFIVSQIAIQVFTLDTLPRRVSAVSTADYAPWQRERFAPADPRLGTELAQQPTQTPRMRGTGIVQVVTVPAEQPPVQPASPVPTEPPPTSIAGLTVTPLPTVTIAATDSTQTPTATLTAIASSTLTPTASPTSSSTPTLTVTSSATATTTATATPTASSTLTATPSPTIIPSATATATQTATATLQPPQAAFQLNPQTGTAPLRVNFTDTSSGIYTTRLWNFAGLATSTAVSPSFIFTQPGTYTITLTIDGSAGVSSTSRQVQVLAAPTATHTPFVIPPDTPTFTPTFTPVPTLTPTHTPTLTPTPTFTPTHTSTFTPTPTFTPTHTSTFTPTPTFTPTFTPTPAITDISLTMTADRTTLPDDGLVRMRFDVNNISSVTANTVQITYALPSNFRVDALPSECSEAAGTITCNAGNIPAAGNWTSSDWLYIDHEGANNTTTHSAIAITATTETSTSNNTDSVSIAVASIMNCSSDPDEPDVNGPDGLLCDIPGSSLVIDLTAAGTIPIVPAAGYDLVFYERTTSANVVNMDGIRVQVGASAGGPWTTVLEWGDGIREHTTNIPSTIADIDDVAIPTGALYGSGALQTGIAIDIDPVTPGIFGYVRLTPANGGTGVFDAIEVLNG